MPPLARNVLRLGAVCLALGVFGWAWESLARQAPSSSWHLAGYPDAVARFALRAWLAGLALLVVAPRALAERSALCARPGLARALVAALFAGTALTLGALAYAAASGRLGVQIAESTGPSHAVLLARLAGDALFVAALGGLLYGYLAPPRAE